MISNVDYAHKKAPILRPLINTIHKIPMDITHPTRKQVSFYDYICKHKSDNGIWPTYREIQSAMGYKSPHSVTQNIQSLIKKGWLGKEDNGAYVPLVQR